MKKGEELKMKPMQSVETAKNLETIEKESSFFVGVDLGQMRDYTAVVCTAGARANYSGNTSASTTR